MISQAIRHYHEEAVTECTQATMLETSPIQLRGQKYHTEILALWQM